MDYKTIIKGRLDFGTARSLENAIKMFERRAENYYKQHILFLAEEAFYEDTNSLVLRIITQNNKKYWKNTVQLLDYLSDFAVAGMMRGWFIDDGENRQILDVVRIEPKNERYSTQQFNIGRELCEKEDDYEKAIIAFSNAIEKHPQHSIAYEWRGHAYRKLGDYEAAYSDYLKSKELFPGDAEPYLGIGKILQTEGKYEESIECFEEATRLSIPREDVYWDIRYHKGLAGVKTQDWEKAAFDLKFFLGRNYGEGDRNRMQVRSAHFYYGYALFNLERYKESAEAFNQALIVSYGADTISEGMKLFYRGLARQKAGLVGFEEDLKIASEQGISDPVLI